MNYVALSQRVPPNNYRDQLGAVYNYPSRYWSRLTPGDRFIYHQPRTGTRGGMVYIGCGLIGEITLDAEDPVRRNAELNDYTPFVKPVPFVQRGKFLEQNISTPTQLRGNAVRIVSEETAALIIQKSGTTPPWSWEFPDTGGDEEIDTSPQNKLRDAIAKFDGMYASLEPEERRKLVGGLHRPSSIGNLLKELYGTTCCICGIEGFVKRNQTRYAEVHHVEELHTRNIGVLGSQNIIIVCANCHRKLHYSDVKVHGIEHGWEIMINGELYRVGRLTDKDSVW